ncbi:hypothetical protein L6164_028971 [Bauhinia variegata]|uniref:Uncharacterized protein n=1 Tax=Bauhinia variegata TaxID=167791 RepID=A0ACB9L7W5_BAUVA|nr:hypothetical protein L6164_028971 [Bauhinia variegata]
MSNLHVLALGINQLSGPIPASLSNISGLSSVDLAHNNFVGSVPTNLGNLQELSWLGLNHNNLGHNSREDWKFLNSMINCSKLEYLSLSANKIGGVLPAAIGNLSTQQLKIHSNKIYGKIPEEITYLTNLTTLNLEQNILTGVIPTSFGKLTKMQELRLGLNRLSGQIPASIGEVPTGGAFKNTSAISIIGNSLLCGGVTELQLPRCPASVTKQAKHQRLKLVIIVICVVLFFFLLAIAFAAYRVKKINRKTSTFQNIEELPKVSYKMLLIATASFSSKNLIGSGSFGSVYKGTLDQEERLVAVKVLNLQKKGVSKSFLAECNALKGIRHRNLVKSLTCCSSIDYNGNDFKALVFEFLTNGSLEKWLHPEGSENQPLDFLQRLNIAIDVASALCYLHNECELPIVHCDLKPSNILLDADLVAKVSDFGLARLLSATTQVSETKSSSIGLKGSVGYAAPEYGLGGKASKEGDVYSFGILILEMFTGKRPTDEIFIDDYNLHNYVKEALPEYLLQVADPILLEEEEEEETGEIIQRSIVSILEIGLACSEKSPEGRMNVEAVTRQLQTVRRVFLGPTSGVRS